MSLVDPKIFYYISLYIYIQILDDSRIHQCLGKFEKPTDLGSLLRFLRIFDLDSGHEASQRHQKNPKKDGFKLCRLGLSADFVIFFVGGSFLQIPHCSYFSATNQMQKMQNCKSEDDFAEFDPNEICFLRKNKSQSVFKQTAVSNFLFLMPSFQQKRHGKGGQAQAWRLGHLCPLQSRWHLGGERCGR